MVQKKGRRGWRPLQKVDRSGLACHGSFVHVEVRVDVLRVVEIFDDFEEPDHGVGLSAFELGVGRGDLGDLGVLGRDLGGLEGFGYGFEVLGVAENLPVFAFVAEVFGAGFEDDLGELVLVGGGFGDGDDAFFREHPGDGTLGHRGCRRSSRRRGGSR